MFSSGSGGKSKRKSFFLFGNDSKTESKPSPTRPSTRVPTATGSEKKHHHHHSSSTHLHKHSPALDKEEHATRSASAVIPDRNVPSIEKVPRESRYSSAQSVPSTTPDVIVPQKTRERIKRPPPPSMDFDEIKKTVERTKSAQLQTQQENKNSPTVPNHSVEVDIAHPHDFLSRDTMLNTHSMTPEDSINSAFQPQGQNTIYQHKRERSQAEELVDDIDLYLKNYKESSKSPVTLPGNDNMDVNHISGVDLQPEHTAMSDDNLIVQIPSNISVEEVSPLLFTSKTRESIPKLYSSSDNDSIVHQTSNLKIANGNSDEESTSSDKFSFNESDESSVLNDTDDNSVEDAVVSQDRSSEEINQTPLKSTNPFFLNDSQPSTNPSSSLRITNATDVGVPLRSINDDDDVIYNNQDTPVRSRSVTNDVDPDLEPRRNFRITNEDRPTFYAPYDSDSDSSSFVSYRPSVTTPREMSVDPMVNAYSTSNAYATPNDSPLKAQPYNEMIEPAENSTTTSLDNDSSDMYASLNASASQISSRKGAESTDNLKSLSTPGSKSVKSVQSNAEQPPRPDKPSRLVSSYVEELRLKYYKTSNFLEAPPNLPMALKQKNNLKQPRDIKMASRTNAKQVGIRHGKVKQKLLALEATSDDSKSLGSANISSIDHTKEFHKLLGKDDVVPEEDENESEEYLNEIPGDEAYDSEDYMAPLREKRGSKMGSSVTRSNTTVSYYTRLQNRPRSGTVDRMKSYDYKLPTNILDDYKENEAKNDSSNNAAKRNPSTKTIDSSALMDSYLGEGGLHLANPDSDSE